MTTPRGEPFDTLREAVGGLAWRTPRSATSQRMASPKVVRSARMSPLVATTHTFCSGKSLPGRRDRRLSPPTTSLRRDIGRHHRLGFHFRRRLSRCGRRDVEAQDIPIGTLKDQAQPPPSRCRLEALAHPQTLLTLLQLGLAVITRPVVGQEDIVLLLDELALTLKHGL
jgi:hypothetical protein